MDSDPKWLIPSNTPVLIDGSNILRIIWSTGSHGLDVFKATEKHELVAISSQIANDMFNYVKEAGYQKANGRSLKDYAENVLICLLANENGFLKCYH